MARSDTDTEEADRYRDDTERPLYVDYCEDCQADRVHFRATNRCQTCRGSIRRDGDEYLWAFDAAEWHVEPFEGYELEDVIPK